MANVLYDPGREGFLDGTIDTSQTWKAVLIDSGAYSFSAAHKFRSSVAGGAQIGTPQTITTKTATNGIADGDDVTFPLVPGTTSCEAVLIYTDTGASATDRLIAYIDSATGLPVTTNGGNIVVTWDSGANKIFKL